MENKNYYIIDNGRISVYKPGGKAEAVSQETFFHDFRPGQDATVWADDPAEAILKIDALNNPEKIVETKTTIKTREEYYAKIKELRLAGEIDKANELVAEFGNDF